MVPLEPMKQMIPLELIKVIAPLELSDDVCDPVINDYTI